jgi:hypothetical protein
VPDLALIAQRHTRLRANPPPLDRIETPIGDDGAARPAPEGTDRHRTLESTDMPDAIFEFDEDDDISPLSIELDKIPLRLWEQTLAPLAYQHSHWIAQQIPDERRREIALKLAFDLYLADGTRRQVRDRARGRALRTGFPLPSPAPRHGVADPRVQLNIRLRTDDHARLKDAARAVGLAPTTLARALVLNGAAQLLRDRDRDRERERSSRDGAT